MHYNTNKTQLQILSFPQYKIFKFYIFLFSTQKKYLKKKTIFYFSTYVNNYNLSTNVQIYLSTQYVHICYKLIFFDNKSLFKTFLPIFHSFYRKKRKNNVK